MLNIVQMLCNYGATYVMKASLSNILVTYDVFNNDCTTKECLKLIHVLKANEEGANISIITFKEFMAMLETSEEELNNMSMVSFDCLYREDAIIKDRKTLKLLNKDKVIESLKMNSNLSTIGDICKDFFDDYFKR